MLFAICVLSHEPGHCKVYPGEVVEVLKRIWKIYGRLLQKDVSFFAQSDYGSEMMS